MARKFLHLFTKHKIVFVLALHCIVLAVLYFILTNLDYLTAVANNNNLLNWDAAFYFNLKEYGYQWIDSRPSDLAFCPLFPLVWKILGFNATGISYFNALIFALSIYTLLKASKILPLFLLLILSIPSFIFFTLPYSESLFFLFGTMLLIGYEKNNQWLIYGGLFLSSITRTSATLFVAAIIFVELTNFNINLRSRISQISGRLLTCAGGIMTVMLIERIQIGKWFNLFEAQKFFRRAWQLPTFPLTTIQPQRTLGYDSVAFSIGIIALFYCTKWSINFLNRKTAPSGYNITVTFSTFVIAATVIVDTFFTFNKDGYTCIWSINRHIFCTPFAIIFLSWLLEELKKSPRQAFQVAALILLNVFVTGVFKFPLMTAFYFLFFGPFVLLLYFPRYKYYWLIFYVVEAAIQLQTFDNFLNHRWIA